MKLLVYDKFWDSFIDLPKGMQKKVVEFQKKFRENSKSSAIHLEPISSFKDKSLRSARIDGTYRAIIKVPDSGELFYLLWVDHHDKAYQWAENRICQWNEATQTVQLYLAHSDAEPSIAQPSVQDVATTFMSQFDTKKLALLGIPEVLLPSILTINNTDDLSKIEKFLPTDVFERLFYLLEGASIDELIFEISEGMVKEGDIEKQAQSINNQRNFIELTDDSLFNEALTGSLSKWKHYLHPSQRKLVEATFKGSVKVSGGAGTGKTIAALHRLKYLTKVKLPNQKILFTTFTKALVANLEDLVRGLEIPVQSLTLTHFDRMVRELLDKYKVLPADYKVFDLDAVKKASEIWDDVIGSELTPYSPEFLESEYVNVILFNGITSFEDYVKTSRKGRGKPISRRQRKEVWDLLTRFNEVRQPKKLFYREELINSLKAYLQEQSIYPFDYCIVDELQDFSNVELRLIRTMVPDRENDLFMVGDPMQSIYNKVINFSQVGINVRGKRSQRLKINYRTTEEIKKLAISIIEDCKYDDFDGEEEAKNGYVSLYHGNKPKYMVFKTKDEEVNFVLDEIRKITTIQKSESENFKYNLSDIAICARTKNGIKDFRNALHKQNIEYNEHDSLSITGASAVSVLTFHKIKGLEFKHVFLVDVNDRTFPKLPFNFDELDSDEKRVYLKNEKSTVYVAISRAKENVCITGVGRASELVRL